jgi:hypothetical protein
MRPADEARGQVTVGGAVGGADEARVHDGREMVAGRDRRGLEGQGAPQQHLDSMDSTATWPQHLDSTATWPQHLDSTATWPQHLDSIATWPQHLDSIATWPQHLDSTATWPQHLDSIATWPQHLDSIATWPQSAPSSPSNIVAAACQPAALLPWPRSCPGVWARFPGRLSSSRACRLPQAGPSEGGGRRERRRCWRTINEMM